jgi:DNA-binding response OmpR family regulator
MLTALDDYATRRKAMQAGATDLLTKPVAKEELLATLRGVIAENRTGSPASWAV